MCTKRSFEKLNAENFTGEKKIYQNRKQKSEDRAVIWNLRCVQKPSSADLWTYLNTCALAVLCVRFCLSGCMIVAFALWFPCKKYFVRRMSLQPKKLYTAHCRLLLQMCILYSKFPKSLCKVWAHVNHSTQYLDADTWLVPNHTSSCDFCTKRNCGSLYRLT